MASVSKCPFCGGNVYSDQKKCPECGAVNELYVEHKNPVSFGPVTIGELLDYAAKRGMPLKKMRFFVGEDYREPCAFGIFRDGDTVTVYKNKSDGSRSIRYSGTDETFAVRELFAKLLDECHLRGIYPENAE